MQQQSNKNSTEPCYFHFNGGCSRKSCGHSHFIAPQDMKQWRKIWAERNNSKLNGSNSELERLKKENAELKQKEKIRHAVEQAKKEVKEELMKDVNELKKKVEKQEAVIGKQQVDIAVGKQALGDIKNKKSTVVVPAITSVSTHPRYQEYYCRNCYCTRYAGHSDCGCASYYRTFRARWYEPFTGLHHSSTSSVIIGNYLALQ